MPHWQYQHMLFYSQQHTRHLEQRLQLAARRVGGLHRQDNGLRIALTFAVWKFSAGHAARVLGHQVTAQDFFAAVSNGPA